MGFLGDKFAHPAMQYMYSMYLSIPGDANDASIAFYLHDLACQVGWHGIIVVLV